MRTVAFWLSLIVVFTIPWEDAITVGTLGTLTRAIGLLLAAVWLASALITGKIRKPHPFHLLVYLFILWNISSIFWSVENEATISRIETYVQFAILAWILWDLYETPISVRAALQAYILGAYVAIGSTIYNYLIGQEISAYSEGRYAGANVNAVDLALILTLGIPLAWHLAISAANGTKGNFQKMVNIAYIPMALFAILLTASRMAVFVIIPAAIYIAATVNKVKPILRILFPIALIGVLVILEPFIPRSSVNRLATTLNSISSGDLGGRVKLWDKSVAIFSEHPILGIGAGDLDTPAELGAVAHNTYLSVLTELGLIGFILLTIILVMVFYQALRAMKWDRGLWLTVYTIWAIGVFTLSWEFKKPTWLFLSLVVISANFAFQGNWSSSVSPSTAPRNLTPRETDEISPAISFTKSD